MNFGWFTTSPHPTRPAHTHGADQGQVGWRLHAVPVSEDGTPEKRAKALCGTWPRHGWGGDLFIDTECSRCVAAMNRLEAAGEVFVDVPEARTEAFAKAYQEGAHAAYDGGTAESNPYAPTPYLHAQWLRAFNEHQKETP